MGDAPAQYAATVGSGTFLATALLADTRERSGDAGRVPRSSTGGRWPTTPSTRAPVLPLVSLMVRRGAAEDELRAVAPERPSGRLLAATAAYEAGSTELGEEWFRDVLEVQPANGAARIGLVECLLTQRRFDDAAAEAKTTEADAVLAATAGGAELFALAAGGDGADLEDAYRRRRAARRELGRRRALPGLGRDPERFRAAHGRCRPTRCRPRNRVFEALLRVREVDGFVRCPAAVGRDRRRRPREAAS